MTDIDGRFLAEFLSEQPGSSQMSTSQNPGRRLEPHFQGPLVLALSHRGRFCIETSGPAMHICLLGVVPASYCSSPACVRVSVFSLLPYRLPGVATQSGLKASCASHFPGLRNRSGLDTQHKLFDQQEA